MSVQTYSLGRPTQLSSETTTEVTVFGTVLLLILVTFHISLGILARRSGFLWTLHAVAELSIGSYFVMCYLKQPDMWRAESQGGIAIVQLFDYSAHTHVVKQLYQNTKASLRYLQIWSTDVTGAL